VQIILTISILSFSFLQEGRHDSEIEKKELWSKTTWRRNIIDLHPECFTLFINGGGGGTEPSPIQIYQFKFIIPEKSIHVSKFSVNWISKISTAAATQSQSSWNRDLKGCQLQVLRILIDWQTSCPLATQSPSASKRFTFIIQILPSSQISRSQGIKGSPANSALPAFLPQALASERVGASVVVKNWPLSRWWRVIKQLSTPFENSTSFHPFISFRHSRSSRSPSSIQKINHPRRFHYSNILNVPLTRKLWSLSICALVTDHPKSPPSVMQPGPLPRS